MTNPYDQVDLNSFHLSEVGIIGDHAIFRLDTQNHKPFEVCVFRDHLVRFLMDELDTSDWHLGNDPRFIQFVGYEYTLAVKSAEGRRIVREKYVNYPHLSVEEVQGKISRKRSKTPA